MRVITFVISLLLTVFPLMVLGHGAGHHTSLSSPHYYKQHLRHLPTSQSHDALTHWATRELLSYLHAHPQTLDSMGLSTVDDISPSKFVQSYLTHISTQNDKYEATKCPITGDVIEQPHFTLGNTSIPCGENTQLQCFGCQTVVAVAEWALQDNATLAKISEKLVELCNKTGPLQPLCTKVSHVLMRFLAEVDPLLKHVGIYEPIKSCSFLGFCCADCCGQNITTQNTPQQIHMAYENDPQSMIITWVTRHLDTPSIVLYGTNSPSNLTLSATGTVSTYTSGAWLGAIHTVTLTNLQTNTLYYFQPVNDPSAAPAQVSSFTTLPAQDEGLNLPFVIGCVGDMGDDTNSAANIQKLNQLAVDESIDAIFHVGDVSYADGYMPTWDSFFQDLQPAMTRVPYMTTCGNHELLFNFTSYKSRLIMPHQSAASPDPLYYSYNIGCMHVVSLDSESIINTPYISPEQIQWLTQDLTQFQQKRTAVWSQAKARARQIKAQQMGLPLNAVQVTEDEIRAAFPTTCSASAPTFLVVYMHRPLYCTDKAGTCDKEAAYLRNLIEDIIVLKGQADLFIVGHMHNYERTLNVYQQQIDPRGPVYIVNGAGGNREQVENDWMVNTPNWSATQISSWGWAEISILSSSQLAWNFYNATTSPQPTFPADSILIQARVS